MVQDGDTVTQPYNVVINAQAGTVLKLGADKVEAMIREVLGDQLNSLSMAGHDTIAEACEEALADEHPVLIGGGDGTVFHFAQNAIARKKPFGVLPLGTLNLLASDILVPNDLEKALHAYKQAKAKWIDAGQANDVYFLCSAAIGVIPEATERREAAREIPSLYNWSALVKEIITGLGHERSCIFNMVINGHPIALKTNVLVIANNGYLEEVDAPINRLRRASLTDGKLMLYSVTPKGFWERMRLLFRLWRGSWQKDPSIWTFAARNVRLRFRKPEMQVGLDGELRTLRSPINVRILPRSVAVLTPAQVEQDD